MDFNFNFSEVKLLIVGDVMLDRYSFGNSTRLSPEAPIPIVNIQKKESRLGGAANVALNAKKLGAKVSLIGIVGQDSNGSHLTQLLNENNITDLTVKSLKQRTITKLRIISNNQQMLRIDEEEIFNQDVADKLYVEFKKVISNYDIVILSDYAKGSIVNAKNYIDEANKYNIKVLVDPKGNDFNNYKGSFCLTPNEKEFHNVVGKHNTEEELTTKMTVLAEDLSLSVLMVTRGAKGITVWQKGLLPFHVPTKAKTVYDVSGAGDTVIATLACYLGSMNNSKESTLKDAVSLANAAAGISVSKQGTTTVTIEELKESIVKLPTKYIHSVSELTTLTSLKSNIVFTNGCFDILHAGHIDYLQKASELGDCLIIAVNSDDSVKRLKGNSRPINKLSDRIKLLCSLQCVTWVIEFGNSPEDNDQPLNLIKAIKPQFLVKGGDYEIEGIVGYKVVQSYGGSVQMIKYKEGYSTTSIINALKKS